MYISKLHLKNWRNFRIVDVNLGNRVFLVGPNASGKSNFLDVFRFLRDISKSNGGGLQKAVEARNGISKLRCLSARNEPQIEIQVELSDSVSRQVKWKYAIGIKQQSRGLRLPLLMYERVWDSTSQQILSRPDDGDKEDQDRLFQTHLEQINSNRGFREIAHFLSSISYLHLVPQLLRHPEIVVSALAEEDPYGRNFLEKVVKTPEKTRSNRLKKIEEVLKVAVPNLRQLISVQDNRGVPHLEAVYEHWRPNAGKQSEEEFSDGTLRLIGFLWAILEDDTPLLLEEPELYLHPSIVKSLPGLIWQIQSRKKRQIIISSHSPDLLEDKGIGAEEVLLLNPTKNGTEVNQASSIREIPKMLSQGFNIGEVVLPRTAPKNILQMTLFND